jgi:hypothetical protein
VPDDDAMANDAVVALHIGNGNPFELCTGALIAPTVVLTARHCVSQVTNSSVVCDLNGQSLNGPQVGADLDPTTMHVYTTAHPDLLGTPVANGKAVFHPATNTLCNEDIALIVLDAVVTKIAPLRVRLVKTTTTNDVLRAVGYGMNDQNQPIGNRYRKDNLGILAVGPVVSTSGTTLAPNDLEVGLSFCEGDSGGPAISEATGAIVGLVARGGACTDASGHIYTETKTFAALIAQAFAVAGGSVSEENGPAPLPAEPDAGAPMQTPPDASADPGGGANPGGGRTGGYLSAPPNHGGCAMAPARGAEGGPDRGAAGLSGLLLAAALLAARRRPAR